ncbi:MAG: AMP-binding protein [Acidimicrobiia bacterium]
MVTPGLADAWAALAAERPDRDAVVAGPDRRTYAELVRRAHALGRWLRARGVAPGDRVALVLPGRVEHFEALAGALSVGIVAVTVDGRARADEVHRVVDATDAKVVVHDAGTARTVTRALKPIQRQWRPTTLETGGSYEDAVTAFVAEDHADLGPPSGVVLVGPAAGSSATVARLDTDALVRAARASEAVDGPHLVLAPLSFGTGLVGSLTTLSAGGTVILPPDARWNAHDMLDVVAREHVRHVTLDGDAQARPLRDALCAQPGRWDTSSLRTITSTDAPLSGDVCDDLARAIPGIAVERTTTRVDDANAPPPRDVIATAAGMVDPARIEARVMTHRGVTACRVIGLADRTGAGVAVALVVVADDHYLDAAELQAWSRPKLAAHEMPRAWLFVDALDTTATDADLRTVALAHLRST